MSKPMRAGLQSTVLTSRVATVGDTATMYDSAAAEFPLTGTGKGQYALVYADGSFANGGSARARFPDVTEVPISTQGTPGTRLYDCEPGCIWPPQAAVDLVIEDVHNGLQSNIYGSESTLTGDPGPENAASCLASAGLTWGTGPKDVGFFLSAPDGVAEVPVGFWAKQYLFGSNFAPGAYDTSVALLAWPMLPQPIPPKPISQLGADTTMFIHVVWPGGKSGETIKSRAGKTYEYGLVVWASPETGINLGNNYPNVETAYGSDLKLVEDPNGTLLDMIPNHIGF
jgi:hypothetical protein